MISWQRWLRTWPAGVSSKSKRLLRMGDLTSPHRVVRANRVIAAVSYNAALTFCSDHSTGAGQGRLPGISPISARTSTQLPRGARRRW